MIINDGQCVKKIKKYYAELKKELDDKSNDLVVVDFKEVKRIDLAMLQLVIAVRCKARDINKKLEFRNVCDRIKDQMSICGIKL